MESAVANDAVASPRTYSCCPASTISVLGLWDMYVFSRIFTEVWLRKQEFIVPKAVDKILECASHDTVIVRVAIFKFQACFCCEIYDLIHTDSNSRHNVLANWTRLAQETIWVSMRSSVTSLGTRR